MPDTKAAPVLAGADHPLEPTDMPPVVLTASKLTALGEMRQADFERGLEVLRLTEERVARVFATLTRGKAEDADLMEVAGVKKPFLTQNGSSKAQQLFGLVSDVDYIKPVWGDGKASPVVFVEAKVSLYIGHLGGPCVGTAIGFCSSWEPKYRWVKKNPTCPKCHHELRMNRQTGEWACWRSSGGCESRYSRKQFEDVEKVENPDQGSELQTYGMIAAKRARVAATRTVTGISRYTTQDEDAAWAAKTTVEAEYEVEPGELKEARPRQPTPPSEPAPATAPPQRPIESGTPRRGAAISGGVAPGSPPKTPQAAGEDRDTAWKPPKEWHEYVALLCEVSDQPKHKWFDWLAERNTELGWWRATRRLMDLVRQKHGSCPKPPAVVGQAGITELETEES